MAMFFYQVRAAAGVFLAAAVVVPLLNPAAFGGAKKRGGPTTAPATRPARPPASAPSAAGLPICPVAVVNVARIFETYQRAKDLTAEMSRKVGAIQEEGRKRLEEVQQLQKEAEAAPRGSEESRRLHDQFQQKAIALQGWQKSQEASLTREHRDLTVEMYNEIAAAIESLARGHGLMLVLNANLKGDLPPETPALLGEVRLRAVLFADERVDITQEVLRRLDEAYRKRKDQAPPPPKPPDDL